MFKYLLNNELNLKFSFNIKGKAEFKKLLYSFKKNAIIFHLYLKKISDWL